MLNLGTGLEKERIRNILSLQDVAVLAAFARQNYRQYPIAWLDWLDRLEGMINGNDALNIIHEGLKLPDLDDETKAQLADRLAELAIQTNRSDMRVEALQKAYEWSPSLERLVRWLVVWRQSSSGFHDFIQMIREKTGQRKRNDLLFHAFLLTGDAEGARLLTAQKEEPGSVDHQQERRKFFLLHQLYALSRPIGNELTQSKKQAKKKRTVSAIGETHREHTTSGKAESLWLSGVESHIRGSSYRYRDFDTEKIVKQLNLDYQMYLVQIDQILQENSVSANDVERSLSWCRAEIDQRVSAIVDEKHRSRYQEAAQFLAALSEAMVNQGMISQAKGLIDYYHHQYRRFSAFRAELNRAVGTLIPDADLIGPGEPYPFLGQPRFHSG